MAFKVNLECIRVNGDKNQEIVQFQAPEPVKSEENPDAVLRRGPEQLTIQLKSTDADFRKFVPGNTYPVTIGK